MSTNEPRRAEDSKPIPRKADAADSASLPTIDLGQEGIVDLGEFHLQGDGSAIPLADLPEPPSGQSLTSWTEVIRRQRAAQAAAQAAEAVEVDAPSDKDLLERVDVNETPAANGVRAKRPGDTSEIRPADLPVYAPPLATPASESDIELDRLTPGVSPSGSEVGFDILYPPSDAGGVMRFAAPESLANDGAKASDDEQIPIGAGSGVGMSGVDLGAGGRRRTGPVIHFGCAAYGNRIPARRRLPVSPWTCSTSASRRMACRRR